MAEVTRETLPPAGPDYPLRSAAAPPVLNRKRSAPGDPSPRPRVLPDERNRAVDAQPKPT